MILNLRPRSEAVLHSVVEELDSRFDDEQRSDILRVIEEVLGKDEGGDDVPMEENEHQNGTGQHEVESNGVEPSHDNR